MSSIQTEIGEYINHCKYEKNLSDKTIKAYNCDLFQYVKFLTKRKFSLEVTQITKTEIRLFLEEISSLKSKSIKRKVASLKTLFNFLEFEDKITVNPFRKMKIKIKESKRLPKVMDIKEVNAIFKSAYQNNNQCENSSKNSYLESLRNLVVVELLFASGARVSEIANINMEDIDISSGTLKIKGKGNKERVIQICNKETLKVLKKYHHNFKNRILKSGGFFLINRQGNKLSDQSIRGIIKQLSIQAKILKHITPHVFRHTLATLLLEKDVDIKYIQSILGHSSIMTTQIYTHVNSEKQRQILTIKHPRKDFSMKNL
jgi:integrase/recombinase XerD